MSLIIRNTSGNTLDINDIGISLEAGNEYDLTTHAAVEIADSSDIVAAIQALDLIVLDPLDDITPLSVNQGVEAIQSFNDYHFRIRGGELNQLDDVEASAPVDGYVLTYVGGSSRWEPQPGGSGGSSNACFPFYQANGTYDPITVTAGQFPFFRADGTPDNINIAVCV